MHKLLVSLYVPQQSVKAVKTALESRGLRDKSFKIQKVQIEPVRMQDYVLSHFTVHGYDMFEIWAKLERSEEGCKDRRCPMVAQWEYEPLAYLLELLDLPANVTKGIELGEFMEPERTFLRPVGDNHHILNYIHKSRNPINVAVQKWIDKLPPGLQKRVDVDYPIEGFLDGLAKSYMIYTPMLLLSSSPFAEPGWPKVSANVSQKQLTSLWTHITAETRTTHIAINAPIPLQTTTAKPDAQTAAETPEANILRAPTNLTPLHGTFGPRAPIPSPTSSDFTSAFWVSHTQNRIIQIWAPRHTMFSRGNIKEKTRLLNLPSITRCTASEKGFTAVDLYCGVGYFAFSYAKAGASVVLGWELNKWSVEGMRQGVEANRWMAETIGEDEEGVESVSKKVKEGGEKGKAVLVTFNESNVKATERIEELRGYVPPVRHVNLGLLPTAEGAWDVAVRALDPEAGGWLHVHENIAVREPEHGDRVEEIVAEIRKLAESHRMRLIEGKKSGMDNEITVQLEHVEQVKTYAPGVMHCVIDIFIGKK